MIRQGLGRDAGVDAELLRQVAEQPASPILSREHVELAERDAAFVGIGKGCDRPHQGALPGAMGPEKSEHAGWNV